MMLLALILYHGILEVQSAGHSTDKLDLKLIGGSSCLDVSTAGYYYGKPSSGASTTWIIDLQGGSDCMGPAKHCVSNETSGISKCTVNPPHCKEWVKMMGSSKKRSLHNNKGGETDDLGRNFTGWDTGGFGPWPDSHSNFTNDFDSGSLGSSVNKPHRFLSNSKTVNPRLHDAHHIWIPYCTADNWLSSIWKGHDKYESIKAYAGFNVSDEFAMTGMSNLKLFIKDIMNHPEFKNAKKVLFAGEGAGAVGATSNAEWVARYLRAGVPSTVWLDFRVFSSAGYFSPAVIEEKSFKSKASPNFTVRTLNYDPPENISKEELAVEGQKNHSRVTPIGAQMYWHSSHLSETCVAGMQKLGLPQENCVSSAVTHKFLSMPVFYTQYAFDTKAMSDPNIYGMKIPNWGSPKIWPGKLKVNLTYNALMKTKSYFTPFAGNKFTTKAVWKRDWYDQFGDFGYAGEILELIDRAYMGRPEFNEEFFTGGSALNDNVTMMWPLEFTKRFGKLTVDALAANSKPGDGYFVMGCLEHVGGLGVGGSGGPVAQYPNRRGGPTETTGCGRSPYDAMVDWFEREWIDDEADRFVDPCLNATGDETGFLPCNPTCSGFKEVQKTGHHCPNIEDPTEFLAPWCCEEPTCRDLSEDLCKLTTATGVGASSRSLPAGAAFMAYISLLLWAYIGQ